ncbi:MAG: response regulator [Lachnospiraceae bacterium]|nr:response regulator [Lachnospiraceae bacterium]
MKTGIKKNTALIAITGIVIVMVILILGTFWMGHSARKGTEKAVRSVSLLYLDELAGRREKVVANNLQDRIKDMQTALELMSAEDLSDMTHLQAYQAKMKRLFTIEKFAFVDTKGLIYTSTGTQSGINEYHFDYSSITKAEISIKNLDSADKKVIIALPVDNIPFEGETLIVCFMEIDMKEMLAGVSMQSQEEGATFCNIYTSDGVALSNTVLGGLAVEDNLLEALKNADLEKGYSYETVVDDFKNGTRGEVLFSYNGTNETLSYVPVEGTDWLLTYLIKEKVIIDKIDSISDGIILRSILQSLLTVIVLVAVFIYVILQNRRNTRLMIEKETVEAENRVKQAELEQRQTLQNALSDALAAAEHANKAKTVFLSNMSHEIRTPMNAIIGLDNIALSDPETPEKTRGYLEKIGDSADHLLNLINDILDMSRIESGRMVLKNEEFSFRKLIEAISTIFGGQCHDKGLEYDCRIIGPVDDYYIGDDMKIRQVLINIIGNAVKFTPSGGKVSLLVEKKAEFEGKTTLDFTVSDTGIGMSEDFLPHIYDTFVQEETGTSNKYGSSGLGLAITKSIVEMMNGNIEVKSKKGEGTTFIISLTLSDSERTESGEDENEIKPEEMTVLIVDDDPVALEHARLVLQSAGITSEVAASGEKALEMIKIRHARRMPYNLILIDWQMPEMDGVECARQIRSIAGNESAIIILTAYRWDDIYDEAVKAGVDSFISKPLFAAAVIEEFRSAYVRKNSADGMNKEAILVGRRVLLAEDVPVNAEIMQMVLKMQNIEVDLAENGKVALEKFENSTEKYYDAILMDMRMPEMDGLEATRRIRSLKRDDAKSVPIIALTANAFDEDVQRSLQAGLNAHLSKPVQPETLFKTLKSLIKD